MNSCASWRLMPARLRQPEVAHPVGEPEVDHLGHRPLVGRDVLGRLPEHPGGGLAVDVCLALERVAQVLVAAHVGEDPELDLAVVRGDERRVRRAGDERVADPAAERRPDRDVLEVRFGARQAPGRRHRLVEQRVEPLVGADQRRQRLDVRRAQLGEDPPLEDGLDDRVHAAQLLEHARVGRVAGLRLAALGQAELDEQDLAQLLGAADRELVAHRVEDLALEPRDLGRELDLERAQRVAVERDARGLHAGEDRDQRQLDLREQPVGAVGLERLLERGLDRERAERLETGDRHRRQARGGRRDDEVQPLPDDVGDLLGPERGVHDVRGDLGVEGDRRGVRVGRLGEAHREQRLDLVPHDAGVDPLEQVAQGVRCVRAVRRDHAPVRARDGERERDPRERPRVVQHETRADDVLRRAATARGPRRRPRPRPRSGPGRRSLPRAHPGRRRRPPRPARRVPRPPAVPSAIASGCLAARGGCRGPCRRRSSTDLVEVERQLELAAGRLGAREPGRGTRRRRLATPHPGPRGIRRRAARAWPRSRPRAAPR